MLQVTVSSDSSDAVEAASAEVHAIADGPPQAAQHSMYGGGPRWSFRDFVSRVGPGASGHPGAGGHPGEAGLPRPDARQRAAFEGRLFGDAAGTTQLLPPRRRPQPPPLTWDLFQDDGQVGAKGHAISCLAHIRLNHGPFHAAKKFAIWIWMSGCEP